MSPDHASDPGEDWPRSKGLELGRWLVKRELGSDAANGVEMMMEYEARGTIWETHAPRSR
ncbi:hypothetical protein GCM10009801_07260 [Streptomyces albiaxialis]|uniref:Uncharacterized protein n=1 Tax=Streptomyces albiaxialis TaxID=329523 RepID=A0ABN2VIL8_9ACTN